MADTIQILIEARDYASSVFRSVSSSARTFVTGTSNAVISFNSTLRGYNNAMRGFNTAVRNGMIEAGRAVYNFTSDAIREFAELERQHAKTMGAMQASYPRTNEGRTQFTADSTALREQAISYGTVGPTGQGALNNATDISLAQTALVKSGVTADELLNTDALQSVVKFAGGNDIDLETAADFAIQMKTMFDIPLEKWGEVFDKITYAADVSPVDVDEMMTSLTRGGGLPGSMGVPVEEVLAALSVMGLSGLKGGTAGTALQAFYSRGINPTGVSTAGPAPSSKVEDLYKQVSDIVVDENGNYTGMENFLEGLNEYTSDLSDQEYAWFARKLFGMFQQKAMYALGRTDENGDLLYSDIVTGINENADGTLDYKWDTMLDSSYGDITKVINAWDGFKKDVGSRMAPVISEFSDQIFDFLTTGNYEFNFENLRQAIYDSGDLIAEKYGDQIGDFVKNLGDFLLDTFQIGETQLPTIGGLGVGILKLFSGDFDGAIEEFRSGIDDTTDKIEDLPPELQDMATGVRNVIIALSALAGFNFITKILEAVTTLPRLLGGWRIASVNTRVTSATTNINGASVNVNGGAVNVNGGAITATGGTITIPTMTSTVATMTASTPLMNVTASVVNVFGGMGFGNGGGGGGLPSLGSGGGFPMLPSGGGGLPALAGGGGSLLLPGAAAAGGYALGAGASAGLPMLGAGAAGAGAAVSSGKWLPFATSQVLNADGSIAATYFGSMSGAQILAAAGKFLGIAGMVVGLTNALTISAGINNSPQSMAEAMQNAYGAGARGTDEISNRMISDNSALIEGGEMPDGSWIYPDEFVDFMQNASAFMNSGEGMQAFYDAINAQLESGGKIDEDFLSGFMTEHDLDRGYGQAFLEQMLNNMFNGDYTTPDHYLGDYANNSVNDFIKENLNNTTDWTQNGSVSQVLAVINGKLDGLTYVYGSNNVYTDNNGAYYQLQEDGTLDNISTAVNNLNQATISLQEAIDMSGLNPVSLGMGPLSEEGFTNRINELLNNPVAQEANAELFNSVANAIREVEIANNVSVAIPRPSVNVDVNVRVDSAGNVTKSVIPNFAGFDSYLFQQLQRQGG